MTPKQKAWKWCSKYIRLRDALEYCQKTGIDPNEYRYRIEDMPIGCCTCGRVRSFRQIDAGHFISRGSGGGSGVYFDERNIHAQCKSCNAFHQGKTLEYNDFMQEKYGLEVIDELRIKDKLVQRRCSLEYHALIEFYKGAYEALEKTI